PPTGPPPRPPPTPPPPPPRRGGGGGGRPVSGVSDPVATEFAQSAAQDGMASDTVTRLAHRAGEAPLAGPVSAGAPSAAAHERPAGTARDGTVVLLVEDEAPVRAFAARALRLQGYHVIEAENGEQALEFLDDAALRVDIFVSDVVMPGLDGPGWVARALVERPGTPVVFVSGYTEDGLSAALSRIPRAVFLGKPFALQDLTETINSQLTRQASA
ncbi:MAG: response regulator, partial [Pararhodobacter sp.]|nr:response regulator [Pararhodobacter sp.]